MGAIERDALQKKSNTEKREEQQRRQIENAANYDKNKHAMVKQEGLLMLRFWHSILSNKMNLLMSRSANIEKAFQKVRTIGELDSTEELVQKILTKEQEYKDLITTVIHSKEKVDLFLIKNNETEKKIKHLEMSKLECLRISAKSEIWSHTKQGKSPQKKKNSKKWILLCRMLVRGY